MKNSLSKLLNSKAVNVIGTTKVSISFLSKDESHPLIIKPNFSDLILEDWLTENRKFFEEKLKQYGGILFRGFQIDAVQKFQHFISAFNISPLEYKQRSSPRYEVAKNVYHSTTYPADQVINMHSENSYAKNWAMNIVFCCIQPAVRYGETPVADNRLVLKYISDATKNKFLDKGIKYNRNISKFIGLSWEEVFQTNDAAVVEEECRKSGMEFKWLDKDRLVLSWCNAAIYDHPLTNEQVWFNHAFFFNKHAMPQDLILSIKSDQDLPFNTFFGDGTEISKMEIEEIRLAYEKASTLFPWEKGDVLFLDNMLMAHGRMNYEGNREVIVSMF